MSWGGGGGGGGTHAPHSTLDIQKVNKDSLNPPRVWEVVSTSTTSKTASLEYTRAAPANVWQFNIAAKGVRAKLRPSSIHLVWLLSYVFKKP